MSGCGTRDLTRQLKRVLRAGLADRRVGVPFDDPFDFARSPRNRAKLSRAFSSEIEIFSAALTPVEFFTRAAQLDFGGRVVGQTGVVADRTLVRPARGSRSGGSSSL